MKSDVVVLLTVFLLGICGCSRHYSIEDRARSQVPVTLAYNYMTDQASRTDMSIDNLETVYVNDSICILQCNMFFKEDGDKIRLDIRYIYLLDMMQSRMAGRPVFSECVKLVPCMPKDRIRQGRRDVKFESESVYESMYGTVSPVAVPCDSK